MTKFKRMEWWILILTILFMLSTMGWFFLQNQGKDLTRVEVGSPVWEEAALQPESSDPAPGILDGEQIDLNTAPMADLTRLPGIGEVMAQRIVDYREENGPFQSIEEIVNVSGIGGKTFEKIAAYITVENEEGGAALAQDSGGG